MTISAIKKIFDKHDHNHSGRISRDEAHKAVDEMSKDGHARHHDDFDAEFNKLAKRHDDHDLHHISFADFLHFSKEHHWDTCVAEKHDHHGHGHH